MKDKLLLSVALVSLFACTNKKYEMQETSMEATIKKGDYVEIIESNRIDYGDIVAFEHVDKSQNELTWIFRVIGKAGDKVEIKNGKVLINNSMIEEFGNLKHSYKVQTSKPLSEKDIYNYEGFKLSKNQYIFHLTKDQKEQIANNTRVLKIKYLTRNKNEEQENLFYPDSRIKGWNIDNYGPIEIPVNEDSLYFLLGDNRHNSLDSRFIGFIKKSQIIGVVKQKTVANSNNKR